MLILRTTAETSKNSQHLLTKQQTESRKGITVTKYIINTINAINKYDNHTRRSFCLLFKQSGLIGLLCAKPFLTYIINLNKLLWLYKEYKEKFIKLTDLIADHNITQRTNQAHT
jgi:hypothetical protein